MRPVEPRYPISNPFGRKGPYIAGHHTGTDFAVPIGTKVRAARGGRVVASGTDDAYGKYIVVEGFLHRNQWWYCHLDQRFVGRGQKVKRGQIIGRSGNTGNSTGPHLHAEQRKRPFGYWNHVRPTAWFPA